jgi:hypothetical protein
MLAGEYRFASVFADLPDPPSELPAADLVFNNLASGELLSRPGLLERTVALIQTTGCPVINHPEAVFRMTRQKGAALLDGIPGLRVPRIERYQRDLTRFDLIAADIAARFSYPVIVRHVVADSSSKSQETARRTATLARDADELRNFLDQVDWQQFYVAQHIDLRKADGNYRKLRASFVGGEIIMSRCQFAPGWMVGGQVGLDFYREFPGLVAEIESTLRNPEAVLGPQLMPVLEAIRDRVPLDVFGLDFDIDDDGRVVMFEAQATMVLIATGDAIDYAVSPKEPAERVLQAFRRLVRAKLDFPGRGPIEGLHQA